MLLMAFVLSALSLFLAMTLAIAAMVYKENRDDAQVRRFAFWSIFFLVFAVPTVAAVAGYLAPGLGS
ncbi:MAG: hypothetical protein AAF739_00410 [Pseudomonadota bacterium]